MSIQSNCGIERLKQFCIAERLEQKRHSTQFERSQTDGLVSVSGDEKDRNLLPAELQLFLEFGSGHTWHGDIENQAASLVDGVGREKCFRRCERSDRKSELHQQVGQRLTDRLIVIDDRHKWSGVHQ